MIGNNSNNEVLTEDEAASLLRVSQRTLYTLRKAGEVPYTTIGRQVRYLRSKLLAWMAGSKGVIEG